MAIRYLCKPLGLLSLPADKGQMIDVAGGGRLPGLRDQAPPREIHLRDLWAVVMRHWKVVVFLTVVVAGGAYLSSRGAIPRYQSNLTVQMSSPKQVFARADDIDVDELALRTDPILSEALVLTTQPLALRVVEALALQLEVEGDPTIQRQRVFSAIEVDSYPPYRTYELEQHSPSRGFELKTLDGEIIAAGRYYELASGPGFSFRPLPPEGSARTVRFSIVRSEHAAGWVRAGLGYRVREGTNAVDISFTGSDPSLVPLVLNQAALELREDGAARARAAAARKREYIAEQLVRAEEAAREKLAELQQFKEDQRITDLTAEEASIVRSISTFGQERQRLLVRITILSETLAGMDTLGIEGLNRLAAIQGTESNPVLAFQIRRLLELYEERRRLTAGALGLREDNPQVQAVDQQIGAGHVALRSAVDAELQSLHRREEAITSEVARLRQQLMAFPGKETRIAQLQLEGSIVEDTYRYLLAQFQQARMQEMTIAPYVSILDGASGAFRIGTNLRQKVLLGLLVGLLLGIGGAFFLEYLDQTIKSAADIERSIGTPVLGRIPLESKLAAGSNGRRQEIVVLTHLSADDPAVEAFRALRTNVTFVGAERPVQLITVTSPGPGEGKSTTAANLALVLAQGGGSTLLVDGDLRRSLLHRTFGVLQEPGLTDVLIGQARAREAIRPEIQPHFDVLPAGAAPPNPAELLSSDAMRRLIAELRRDYEFIVMDTPPSLPVTDAVVLSALADATILVMRAGETEETAAQRAVEELRRVRARVAGAVLNGVSARGDRYYTYYSRRYGPRRRRAPTRSLRSRLLSSL